MMLSVCMSLALGVTGDGEDTSKLAELCQKIESTESYTFEATSESDGESFFGRGGGGDGQEEGPPPPVVGMVMKGSPVKLHRGETEAFRENDQLVVKTEEGWQVQQGFGGRGPGGGDRGARPERGGGEGGQRGDRPERGGGEGGQRGDRGGRGGFDRGAMALRTTQLPHEMLKGFADKVAEVTTEEAEGKVIYKGKLTAEGAQSLSFGGAMRRGGFGGGGGGPEMNHEGTFEVVSDPAHHTVQLTLKIKTSGSFGERSFERTTTTKVALKDFGTTKYEVPADALAQFEI